MEIFNENDIIIIDNFFENPDEIFEEALTLSYVKSNNDTGWVGHRRKIYKNNKFYDDYLMKKLIENNPKYKKLSLKVFFHYTLESDKYNTKQPFDSLKIHKDTFNYAGVVYLSKNPLPNSGTSFYDDNYNKIYYVDNIYNRFVFYPGKINHAPENLFGNVINNSRMTLTVFADSTETKKLL